MLDVGRCIGQVRNYEGDFDLSSPSTHRWHNPLSSLSSVKIILREMHGFPQRNSPSLSSSKCSEVELEIIKMTNVTRDIRIVIENILDAKDL